MSIDAFLLLHRKNKLPYRKRGNVIGTNIIRLLRLGKYCAKCKVKPDMVVLIKQKMKRKTIYIYQLINFEKMELFTKDHFFPLSFGGADEEFNLQLMCYQCNAEKGSLLPI